MNAQDTGDPNRAHYAIYQIQSYGQHNSKAAWSFLGVNGVEDGGGTFFSCSTRDRLITRVASLDASWGYGTSFAFNLTSDLREFEYFEWWNREEFTPNKLGVMVLSSLSISAPPL